MEISISIDELRKRKLFLGVPMYGGQCAGLFAKSLADLTAMCTNHGIQLRSYFLFNESLITRARNYIVDEFMRSDATHLMFIDSDIGFDPRDVLGMLALQSDDTEYDVMAGPYPKKSLDFNTIVTTEDGPKKLGKIVNQRYNGRVLSYSDVGGFEFKPILAHHRTEANGKQWVKMIMRDSYGNITATHDHEIATVDDIFKPEIVYRLASDMAGRTIVRVPAVTRNKMMRENPAYSSEQLEFLYGTLLGDSSIKKNGQLTCAHSAKARDYAELKANLFNMKISDHKVKLGDKTHNAIGLYAGVNEQLKQLRSLLYVNGKKTVRNIVDRMTIASFAMLYMDDGYYHKHNEMAMFCTESFSGEDNKLLSHKLETLGFKNSVEASGRIRIHKRATLKFFEAIWKFVIPSMEYKLGNYSSNEAKYNWSSVNRLNYVIQRCRDVVKLNTDRDQYDITVADNYNFVTKGTLVHNCISWEKIKLAVDKGIADQDPNVLERYVGDYVFNPKAGSGTIRIDIPVEVSEVGTGFMMIRRKTFEKFSEAFPQYSYKPDHVRTEHFDGSREIMQYFQAEIDEGSKRYLSEDYWFCKKLQDIGMKIWYCPWMRLQHVGSYIFGGSLVDLAQIGAPATCDSDLLKKKKV